MAKTLDNLLDDHLDFADLRESLHLSLLDFSIQIITVQQLKNHAKMLSEFELRYHIYNSV